MTLPDSLREVIARKDALLDSLLVDRVTAITPHPAAGSDVTPWSILAAAFFGAFFAFLFARLGEWLTSKHARGKAHRNSLARLERLGQDFLNDIITNRTLTGQTLKALAAGAPYWQFPHVFAIYSEFTMEILDLDLTIRIASFHTLVKRFNRTVEDHRRAHDDVQKAMLDGNVPREEFAAASLGMLPLWRETGLALDLIDDEIRDLSARAVLMVAQYESTGARLLRAFGSLRTWPLKDEAVTKERAESDARRKNALAASREKLAKARGATIAPIDTRPPEPK